jgi:hypothetical protein
MSVGRWPALGRDNGFMSNYKERVWGMMSCLIRRFDAYFIFLFCVLSLCVKFSLDAVNKWAYNFLIVGAI